MIYLQTRLELVLLLPSIKHSYQQLIRKPNLNVTSFRLKLFILPKLRHKDFQSQIIYLLSMLTQPVCSSLRLSKALLLPFRNFPGVPSNFAQMSNPNPIENSIRTKLTRHLDALHIEVLNESYMHNVPKGAETHFKVTVVSKKFIGVPLIARHRLVYALLEAELNGGVHALSLHTKTPDQWATCDGTVEPTPKCRGGFGK